MLNQYSSYVPVKSSNSFNFYYENNVKLPTFQENRKKKYSQKVKG